MRWWLALSAVSFGAFLIIRIADSYGNAYPYTSIASLDFWIFAKYPPDLAFLTWSFGCGAEKL